MKTVACGTFTNAPDRFSHVGSYQSRPLGGFFCAVMPLSMSPVLAYHGCDVAVAEDIINGRKTFNISTNEYDWLGAGTYFWIGSHRRAMDWAQYQQSRGRVKTPAVICALIDLGYCLNLTDLGATTALQESFSDLGTKLGILKEPMPKNSAKLRFGIPLFRQLDCAVIENLHKKRKDDGDSPYDTVLGAFEEGNAAFEGAAIRERSHLQLAVRAHSCIRATFRQQSY